MLIDSRVINFGVEILHGDHTEAYELPAVAAINSQPLRIMESFMEAHEYSAAKIKIKLPISSKKYEQIVDPITFQCLESKE